MKVATWNVNGIRARATQFAEWAHAEQPDVICLQELKATPEQVPAVLCELPGYRCRWHGARAYSGVGLLVREDLCGGEALFEHPPFDEETRIVTIEACGTTFASVYVPNGGKDYPAKIRFVEAMVAWAAAARAAGRTLVVCGDMNIAHTDRDVHPRERKAIIGQLPEERALFDRLLAAGLVDVGRTLDPDNDELFTWWAPWRNMRARNIGWRLDYVLASTALAERARTCTVRREVGTSDHAPVVAEFEA